MPEETKFWCLKTHKYITAVPSWAVEDDTEIMPVQKPGQTSPLQFVINVVIALVLQTGAVYLTWNYGVAEAFTFTKHVTLIQALALVCFINWFRNGIKT